MKTRIGFLGFGEVGQRFAADLRAQHADAELATFDNDFKNIANASALQVKLLHRPTP